MSRRQRATGYLSTALLALMHLALLLVLVVPFSRAALYPELRFLDRHKWFPIVGYAGAMYLVLGPAGVVWGFVVSTIACLHVTACINSLAHVWGTRRFDTPDTSRNNAFLAILTFGEGWHNNHHHDMLAARQGLTPWELDLTYLSLKALERLGVVWDVRPPSSRPRIGGIVASLELNAPAR